MARGKRNGAGRKKSLKGPVPPDTGPDADPEREAYEPPDPRTPVKIDSGEFEELEKGLPPVLGALKRLAGLAASVELDTPRRNKRLEEREDLAGMLKGFPRTVHIAPRLIPMARIAARYRHADLTNLQADEKARGIQPNPDLGRRIAIVEELGRKVGIQLDVLVHQPKNRPDAPSPQLGLQQDGDEGEGEDE